MTQNQLHYQANLESARANKAREIENNRDNVARLANDYWKAVQTLAENKRSNLVNESLTSTRIGNEYTLGTNRNELGKQELDEATRSHKATEKINMMGLGAKKFPNVFLPKFNSGVFAGAKSPKDLIPITAQVGKTVIGGLSRLTSPLVLFSKTIAEAGLKDLDQRRGTIRSEW